MISFHHTLVTRFNLAVPGREVAFRNRPGWLEERFSLFERYCLPSVQLQSLQDFDWILFFDDQTPDWARREIGRLQDVRPFHAYYTPVFDNWGWARAIRGIAGPPMPGRSMITSNLDSDDALSHDYMARIRHEAETNSALGRFAINVPDGCVLCGSALFAHRHPTNAFTNLVEPDDERFETTMTIRHMELTEHVPVIQSEGPPGWLQVVHGGNVSNRVRGKRVARAEAHRQFPAAMLGLVRDPSWVTRALEAFVAAPLRFLRDQIFVLFRRVVRVDPDA